MTTLRICCIECGDSGPLLRPLRGGYTDYFTALLRRSVAPGREVSLSGFAAYDGARLPNSAQELREYDGIVLTGSKSSAFDDDPWIHDTMSLIRLAHSVGLKMAGICFGHQLIARALGGTVARNPSGWELAVTPTVTFDCPALLPSLTVLRLQQMHRDIVTVPPPIAELQILGASKLCDNQAMYLPHAFFSVQGHPEYDARTVELLVSDRVTKGIIPRDVGEDALTRTGDDNDNDVVGQAIVRFFDDPSL